ncbi:MAG TPA: asparagine synthase (glutamine-hydrolyzing), partial [Candidatus Polarisedimenticolia bacterium]|nr:asparagine synthase (glutamine-hydrolyzing) [Candidatus Polarisedimenticolia bacterium]
MIDAMARRGPDDSGLYVDPGIALGHRRLAVIDVSPAGHQPMTRAGGRIVIVYNGEIYNFAELRRDLEARGHRFESRTDTEVIMALYEEYGVECLSRLRGMFAFALWDRRAAEPRLLLARDHYGIKPLVYAETGDRLLFASDLAGLLASGHVEDAVDSVARVQYLMHGHVVQPRTWFKGIRMLPPGHRLVVTPGAPIRPERYWGLEPARCEALSAGMDFETQAAQVRSLLEAATAAQMVSDVPLGAFLSGGVDSTALVALMGRAAGRPIHTFSVGFPETDPDLDESPDAERSAAALGAVHRAVPVSGRELADRLPAIAVDLGQPSVDGVNIHLVSGAARPSVTVALSGLGGDEFFAGYSTFEGLAGLASPLRRLRLALGRSVRRVGRARTPLTRAWDRRAASRRFAATYLSYRMVRSPEAAWRLAGSPAIDPEELFAHLDVDADPGAGVVQRVTRLESSLFMTSQLLRDADAASMAHSLEVRVPLLDVDLTEFAFGLPAASHLGAPDPTAGFTGKRVFVRALRGLIPEWTWRKPKRGFTLPFGTWLRGPMRGLADDVIGSSAAGGFDAALGRAEWNAYR